MQQTTYGSDVRHARTLAEVFDDTVAILRQDAGEYAFAALLGGAPACFGALVLRMIDSPVSVALIPPLVIFAAALTFAAASESFRRVSDNLAPDAAEAYMAVVLRAPLFLRPWFMLAAVLAGVTGVAAFFGDYLNPLASAAVQLAALFFAWVYAQPRTFMILALLTQRCSFRQAEDGSAALVAAESGRVLWAWAIALGPALLLTLLALLAGFGTVSTALAALAAVGLMPVAAVIMSLMFYGALSRADD